MKIVIAGGSGFLGRSFAAFLASQGHEAVVLTRNPQQRQDVLWDGKTLGDWCRALNGAAAVVNLAGRSVNCVYTEVNRREILDSRVNSVRVIDAAVAQCPDSPEVIIQAASLAIYGNTTAVCDEAAPHGVGFSVDVCELWEEEFFKNDLPIIRKCALRIGFVLGAGGGALAPLRRLTRWFLGGTVGSGNQYISWLHINDLNRMLLACIQDRSMHGVYNATGPTPVTNRDFMRALRKSLSRPWSPPVPAFAVRFGALYILGTQASLALTGRKCFPRRLEDAGFTFEFTDLDETLASIMAEWDHDAA